MQYENNFQTKKKKQENHLTQRLLKWIQWIEIEKLWKNWHHSLIYNILSLKEIERDGER